MKSRKPLSRHTPLRSGPPPTRGGPIKKRNTQRHAKNVERANGPPSRREWIKTLPSVASGQTPCEGAHVRNGGMSRKADARFVVPLTHVEHMEQLHKWGPATFEAHYGIDLDECAARTEAEWQRISAREVL